jgi:cytochrome P460
MNRIFKTAGALIAALFFSAAALSAEMPGADPAQLWNYITRVSPYTSWSYWPDHQGMQRGRAPHGPKHRVFVNDIALKKNKVPLPQGSIQVKESYSRSGRLMNITVMYKIKGFNPADGNWFWAKYNTKGFARPSGKPRGCIGCHGTRERNDFVLVHDF